MTTTAPESLGSASPEVHASTMCEAFQATAAAYAEEVAVRSHDGQTEITFGAYADRVRSIAAGMAAKGVARGDTVALLLVNRPEFHLCDTAAVHLGATPFSIYATSSPEQVAYLLDNSQADLVITQEVFVDKLIEARGDRGRPSTIVCLDGRRDGTITLEELEAAGDPAFDFETAWRAVQPDDVLTLIYTSGTTGPPKGVELTHANMLAQCRGVSQVLPMRPGARITSYLPSAHIADRWSSHYNQMCFGLQITTVPDPKLIAQVLPEVRPTVWGAVPRVAEKLKAALEAGLQAEPDEARREAVLGAIELAKQKVRLEQAGEPVPEELAQKVAAMDEAVLSKLRAKLGLDQVEWFIIGAAPLARAVQEFLLALGLPISEIYGMSECSCCVTVTAPAAAKIGSVGQVIEGCELRLDADGELLVRGATIMKGYRNEPEKTAEAMTEDGWLRTGDICSIDDEGYVRIVDRKKELIINAAGKNMSPANIEQELKSADPLIGQAAVIGDQRPYNVALLVLDPDIAAAAAPKLGIDPPTVAAVAADERVRARIAQAVEQANGRLSRVEQIKRYELLTEEWAPGGDELTPTMKLKRKPINQKYEGLIEGLYAG
ncbi:long-chain fatty acid--CoA ligase [Conexibacter sp. SYSU D00693]|uniref:AMP-dependent synthetase/ligase n=1 Tax=Conexibacter sp. SYSU D00693 TaxID=2812560 RepID=UPI00196A356C|nr:AMP-dependent synthetase/ligase [Conexibacter sp. SYSU D00693]